MANIVLGAIYLDLFSLEQAQEHLEQPLTLAFRLGSSHWHQIALGFLVHAYILQRKLSRAEEVLSSFSAHTPMHTIGQRQAWSAMAELSLARGNVDLALEVTDRLFNLMPTSLEAINFTLPRLANLHCTILSKLNRETEIPAILDLGLKSAIDQGALPLVWRFHVQLGQMKRQQRKYRQSDRHYVEARRLVDRLANTISDPSLRENFLGRAGGMIPEPSPTRAARHAFGGLTKREFEVSTLIALRQSNQDIADQLGVAKHYIDKYFESILAKLGLNSRAQIAEWVMYRQVADNFKRRQHKKGNENEPSFTKSDTKTE